MSSQIPSSRYQGPEGEAYYAWQSEMGHLGAMLDRDKFAGYVTAQDVVLDFGCGGGFLLAALPARKRLGVQINSAASSVATDNGLTVFSTLQEVPADSVDVVISNHALEHVHRPFDELCEIRRILTAYGRLILWLPINDWRSDRGAVSDVNHHLYTWTSLTLRNLLSEAGFAIDECAVVTSAWSQKVGSIESRLPPLLDHLLRYFLALAKRRRQLKAIARPADDAFTM